MSKHNPNLTAELIPEKSSAGFEIGKHFYEILKRIGHLGLRDEALTLEGELTLDTNWTLAKSKYGFPGASHSSSYSLAYMNNVVCLEFEKNLVLYKIVVGPGYIGSYHGVRPGDKLNSLKEKNFSLLFNDMDDEFLLVKESSILKGISFLTNYRSSIDEAPDQDIQYISIHDWSLR